MLITVQRTCPAWPAKTKLRMTLDPAGTMLSRLVPPWEVTVHFMVDLRKAIRYSMNIA